MEQQNRITNVKNAPNQPAVHEAPSLLVTVAEAARVLCVSQRTMYRMIERNQIRVVKITPDTPRIRRADLEAFAA